ncbi:MAG: hypothetical protein K2J78_06150 [Muribaculaceae bacterium]|nr:hypothetical protein [Muribaculaceae bacterium]
MDYKIQVCNTIDMAIIEEFPSSASIRGNISACIQEDICQNWTSSRYKEEEEYVTRIVNKDTGEVDDYIPSKSFVVKEGKIVFTI